MSTKFIKAIARLIIIVISVSFVFTLTQFGKTENITEVVYYNYDEFETALTMRVLGIEEVKDEINDEPIDVIDESIEVTEPIEEELVSYNTLPLNSHNVICENDVNINIFEEVVTEISPGLSGIGESIVLNCEEYGIKPSFQLAVFCLESGYGKSGLAEGKNNIGGLNAYATSTATVYENAFSYETKSDCVEHFGSIMYNRYISDGLTTVTSIANIYCPPNSANWSNNVMGLMDRIDNLYNSKVSSL